MERLIEYDYLAGVRTGDLKAGVDPRRAFDRLAAYEDTGLEPEDILSAADMAKVACALIELNAYKNLGPINYLWELVRQDRAAQGPVP